MRRWLMVLPVLAVLGVFIPLVTPAHAQSTPSLTVSNSHHLPTVTLYIKQNPATKHNYFAPTYPCIRGEVANVTIKNTTKQRQAVAWDIIPPALPKPITVNPGKSITSVRWAIIEVGVDNQNYAIGVLLNPKVNNLSEAEALVWGDGVLSSCIK